MGFPWFGFCFFVGNVGIAHSLWGNWVPHMSKASFRRKILSYLLAMISDAKECN